jgi:hypothetical protein
MGRDPFDRTRMTGTALVLWENKSFVVLEVDKKSELVLLLDISNGATYFLNLRDKDHNLASRVFTVEESSIFLDGKKIK